MIDVDDKSTLYAASHYPIQCQIGIILCRHYCTLMRCHVHHVLHILSTHHQTNTSEKKHLPIDMTILSGPEMC